MLLQRTRKIKLVETKENIIYLYNKILNLVTEYFKY